MITFVLFIIALTPFVAQAGDPTLGTIIEAFTASLGTFVAVGVAVALVVFVWGVVKFIAAAKDDQAIAEGKQRMIWGIVGLFVIVSMWGIVSLLITMFGVESMPDCSATSVDPESGFLSIKDCLD